MDCRTFANKHHAFVDDTLPGVDMSAMRTHLERCVTCQRRDADMRRSLLLFRNLPRIEVSEGFGDLLRARIERESRADVPLPGPSRIRWAAAALIVAIGGTTWAAMQRRDAETVRLPAVVASEPPAVPTTPSDDATPAYVASMSTALPMWPALMHAEEGSVRFAAIELQAAAREPERP